MATREDGRLAVHFKYNEHLKDLVKQIEGRIWDPKISNWLVPAHSWAIWCSYLRQREFRSIMGDPACNKTIMRDW